VCRASQTVVSVSASDLDPSEEGFPWTAVRCMVSSPVRSSQITQCSTAHCTNLTSRDACLCLSRTSIGSQFGERQTQC
jgi:hypothetical protein